MALGPSGSIATSSELGLAASGSVFDISGGGNQTIKDLSGVAGSMIALGTNTLTAGAANSTTFAGAISGTGGLVKTGTGTLTLRGGNTYTGATTVDGGTLALGPGGSIAASSELSLAASGSVFDISGGGSQTIRDLSGVAGSAITLGANTLTAGAANSTTFAGAISGTGGLVKTGTGTLTLSGVNTYTGATTVDGGTLALGPGGSIAASSELSLAASGSVFDISGGGSQTIRDLSGVAGSAITLGANTLTAGAANSTTFAGAISGTGGLSKTGSGTLTLSGVNAYTGATTVDAGALALGPGGSIAASSELSLAASGSVFDISDGGNQTIKDLSGVAGSMIALGTNTLTAGAANSTTFAGAISGTGGLVKTGTGTLTLRGANTFTGGTSVDAGTLSIDLDAELGAAKSGLTLGGATNGGTLRLTNTSAFFSARPVMLNPGGGTIDTEGVAPATLSGAISGPGGLTKSGAGTLVLGNPANSFTGGIAVGGGSLSVGADGALGVGGAVALAAGTTLALTASGTYNHALTMAGDPTITVHAGQTATFGGQIADGTTVGTLSVAGGGVLALTNTANSYSGGTSVAGGSTLSIDADAEMGTAKGGLTLGGATSGGTLRLTNTSAFFSARPVTLNPGGGTIDAAVAAPATLSGAISGTGGLSKTGTGTLTLSGGNTYTGATTVDAGALALGPSGSIATSSELGLAASGSVFDISAGGNQTIRDLSGVAGSMIALGTNTLTAGAANSTTFAGAISGTGGLVKTGTGMLTLSGNSGAFAGTTSITGGMLEVGDANNPTAKLGGNVTVGPVGALAGHGTIGGSVTNMSGVVAPGGSIGTLMVGGNFTQGSAGALVVEVSPTVASQLVVGGKASLAGTLALVYDPGTYSAKSYTLVQAASVSGSFSAVTGQVPTPELTQTVMIDPMDVQLILGGVTAPTNDTIFAAMTSALILNGQQANVMVLDRLNSRLDANPSATASLVAPVSPQLAQAGSSNLGAVGAIAASLPGAIAQYGGWFRGIGSFAQLNGNATAPGFGANSGGFLVGFDRPVAPDLYLGAAAGYIHTDVQEHSTSSGDNGTGRFMAYGGGWAGPALWTATAGYAHDGINTARGFAGVGTATEAHNGNEFTLAVQGSQPLVVNGVTVTPKAGVPFLHLDESGFTESGANGLDLSSGARSTDSLQPYVGLSAAQTFVTPEGMQLTPEVRLGYSREVLSNSRALTVATLDGTNFLVQGINPSRDMLTTGVGVTARARDDVFLYANYDALLRTGNTTVQTVSAGLRIRF